MNERMKEWFLFSLIYFLLFRWNNTFNHSDSQSEHFCLSPLLYSISEQKPLKSFTLFALSRDYLPFHISCCWLVGCRRFPSCWLVFCFSISFSSFFICVLFSQRIDCEYDKYKSNKGRGKLLTWQPIWFIWKYLEI